MPPDNNPAAGVAVLIFLLIEAALVLAWVAGAWRVFSKAGQPGWAAIIPIYNIYVWLKVAQKPGWWVLLFFIPVVSLIPAILGSLAVAANFGKGAGYAVGMIFLPFIFYPMLGFGDAKYIAAPPLPN